MNSLRLETKSEPDDVETALANLTNTFNSKMSDHEKSFSNSEAAFKKRMDDLELKLNRPGFVANDNKDSTLQTKAFDTFIRKGKEGLNSDEVKSLIVSDDTAGGYLAPDSFNAELDRNIVLFSPVRSVARVLPTSSGAVLWPKRTGGMTSQWLGETQARPATTVTFGNSRYPVCDLGCYVDVSTATLEDTAFDIPALLSFEFAEEFGYEEGKAFVNGANQLSPSGFMQDASLSYTPSGSASAVTADSLIDLYQSIKTPYRANAVWGMNSATLGAVRKLKDSQNRYLLSLAGLENSPATTILGRPVIEMPDMPDVGAGAFPIVFGDFANGYRIFDRISLSIIRDPYSQATNGFTRFHGRRRVAGGVGKAEAIRKLKISVS